MWPFKSDKKETGTKKKKVTLRDSNVRALIKKKKKSKADTIKAIFNE